MSYDFAPLIFSGLVPSGSGGGGSGDVTLAPVGSSPNADGASLSGQVLNLEPADATHPGILTAGTQTIGGAKTFSTSISLEGSTSGAITQEAANVTTNYAVKWPAAQGSMNDVLENDGSGNLSWVPGSGSGANTALSNLITTAINQDLIFDTGAPAFVKTKNDTAASQAITIASGDSSANVASDVNILVGSSGSGVGGRVFISAGTSLDNTGGAIQIVTGAGATSFNSGDLSIGSSNTDGSAPSGTVTLNSGLGDVSGLVTVTSGIGNSSDSGEVIITSGPTLSSSSTTGNVSLKSGNHTNGQGGSNTGTVIVASGNSNGSSSVSGNIIINSGTAASATGDIQATTGNSTGSSPSGSITIDTGTVVDGTSGALDLSTGSASGNGISGSVDFRTGATTNNSSGNVVLASGNAAGGPSGSFDIRTGTSDTTTGDISLTIGTPSGGGTQGNIKLVNGSEGTAGQIWTSTDSVGSGAWSSSAGTSLSTEASLGTLTWSAIADPSGTISKTYRYSINGSHQVTFLAKITATVAGTTVTAVSFPLPGALPTPATWAVQESSGLITPGAGSMTATLGSASSGSSGLYEDGAGGYVVKIFDVAALSATNAFCSITYFY